jgi:sugar phosphate isomerase/epimerase
MTTVELGFHTIHFSPLFGGRAPLLSVIEEAGRAGFTAIGVDEASVAAHVAAGGSVDDVGSALAAAGLTCTDVLYLPVGDDAAAVTAGAGRLARLAAATGARMCVTAVTAPLPAKVAAGHLSAAAAVLADAGVRLAVEFVPYGELRSLVDAAALCDAVGWGRAGLLLDSLHVFRSGTDLAEVARLSGSQVALVQLSDAAGPPPHDLMRESRHLRRVPGEGDLDLCAFAAAVVATGFDGPVTAEVLSDEVRAGDPADIIPRIRASMLRCWPAGS